MHAHLHEAVHTKARALVVRFLALVDLRVNKLKASLHRVVRGGFRLPERGVRCEYERRQDREAVDLFRRWIEGLNRRISTVEGPGLCWEKARNEAV